MGIRGPAPMPTAIRVMRGNPSRRPLPVDEPHLPIVDLEPPADMRGDALAEWRRVVPLLVEMRVLTAADHTALVVYCEAVDLRARALRGLKRSGLVSRRTGRASAYLRIAGEAEDTIKAFGDRFGLNPSFRSRLKAAIRGPELDEFEKWEQQDA